LIQIPVSCAVILDLTKYELPYGLERHAEKQGGLPSGLQKMGHGATVENVELLARALRQLI
jgi:hypothetical protein